MTWKTLSSRKRVDFPLFKVFEDLVKLPNGLELDYYRIENIPVATILPIFADKLVMIRQYRYPIRAYSLELPAGHVASTESPRECAKRELKEETGFTASKIEKLTTYNPSTELSDQVYHIFLATDLERGDPECEKYEIIEVELLPLGTVVDMIIAGTIVDGRTIAAVLLAKIMGRI